MSVVLQIQLVSGGHWCWRSLLPDGLLCLCRMFTLITVQTCHEAAVQITVMVAKTQDDNYCGSVT